MLIKILKMYMLEIGVVHVDILISFQMFILLPIKRLAIRT